MKSDNMFLIAIIIGSLVILGTGIVRATTTTTSEFCTQHQNNPLCTSEGLSFEQPFAIESPHITWEKSCGENS